MEVKGNHCESTKPVIGRKSPWRMPDGRLKIADVIEGVKYVIVKPNPVDLKGDCGSPPPQVGESIQIDHRFHKYAPGTYSYEHLTLFIFRNNNPNFVAYFETVEELEAYLNGMELRLDTEWARDCIEKLSREIDQIRCDYHLAANQKESQRHEWIAKEVGMYFITYVCNKCGLTVGEEPDFTREQADHVEQVKLSACQGGK
jgi:hypothetical protein